jgi:hypothetical protein
MNIENEQMIMLQKRIKVENELIIMLQKRI